MLPDEVIIDDYILRLDGTVVEVLHAGGTNHRWHVNHVRVDGKPKGRDLKLSIGVDMSGIISGVRITAPEAVLPQVNEFFARAKAARTVVVD